MTRLIEFVKDVLELGDETPVAQEEISVTERVEGVSVPAVDIRHAA